MSNIACEDSKEIPLVTIITPTYNSNKEYLFEAVSSVLQQTYPKIEYIITDDGSQYFPEKEVQQFLEEHATGDNIVSWQILKHETNVGTVKNMNAALQIAQGEYIFGLAHDDIYYDERVIEEWVEEFQSTDAKIITGIRSTKNLQTGMEEYLPTVAQRKQIRSLSPQRLFMKILRGNVISGASTAYARACFQEYGLFDEEYRLLEDWPYYLKILSKGERIGMWDRPVIHYRWGGISNTKMPASQLEADILNTRYKYHHILKIIQLKTFNDMVQYYFSWVQTYLCNNLSVAKKAIKNTHENKEPDSISWCQKNSLEKNIWIWIYRYGKVIRTTATSLKASRKITLKKN